jgi:hypothetical protein
MEADAARRSSVGDRCCEVGAWGSSCLPPRRPGHGSGLSVVFFEDDVDAAAVRAAISAKAQEIGWNDEPRPAPESETFYRVMRHG